MTTKTHGYFGDGVYAEFTGFDIVLTANGIGEQATDRIYIEPHMLEQMLAWTKSGYRDHSTGKTFAESNRP